MRLTTPAIIIVVRPHGEHDAIVRALTPDEGVQPGYVRGGRSRRLRPVLVQGNIVAAEFRARTEEQLAHLAGLDRTYVGSVERGERNVSLDNIWNIALALGVHPSELIK